MNELIEKIKTAISHNQFLAIAFVLVVGLGIYFVGCASTTPSPFDTDNRVTREQLTIDVDYYVAQVRLAYADLDRQDIFKQKLAETGLAVAEGGTISPIGALVTLLGIAGAGACADNRRKDAVIKSKTNALDAITAKITTNNINADVTIGS